MSSDQLIMDGVVPPMDENIKLALTLATRLADLTEAIENNEIMLAKMKAQRDEIAEKSLPDLLAGIGLTELTASNGRRIIIKQEYFASVSKERMPAVLDWLKDHNMSGIAKERLEVEPEHAAKLVEAIVPFTATASIHPSTLRAFVRERIEADPQFPKALFGASVNNRAVVKNS